MQSPRHTQTHQIKAIKHTNNYYRLSAIAAKCLLISLFYLRGKAPRPDIGTYKHRALCLNNHTNVSMHFIVITYCSAKNVVSFK